MAYPTFVPGRLGTVTINALDVQVDGNVVSWQNSRTALQKAGFGVESPYQIGGLRVANFSASGHVTAEKYASLIAAYEEDDPVECTLQIGTASALTDAGEHEGNFLITDLTVSANADGEFDWSLSAISSGPVTFTPGTGASA